MRIRTAIPAMAMAVVIAFSSAAIAGDARDDGEVKIKTKKMETTRVEYDDDWADNDRWDRGEWTTGRDVTTVQTEREYVYRQPRMTYREGARIRGGNGGATATRELSGPYRYFFTDAQGKYDYYLDRYGYPYQYGGRQMSVPTGVLGYVPPEEVGGGPVQYYRDERPLSWSIFDERGR